MNEAIEKFLKEFGQKIKKKCSAPPGTESIGKPCGKGSGKITASRHVGYLSPANRI